MAFYVKILSMSAEKKLTNIYHSYYIVYMIQEKYRFVPYI